MSHPARRIVVSPRGPLHVIGLRRAVFTDLYYLTMEKPWSHLVLAMVVVYLLLNTVFATLYVAGGDCLANAHPGSFLDAFFFSVQTLATIGYGFVYPKCLYSNILVTMESFMGLMGVAVTTGIAFNKFAKPRARVQFSRSAVISRHEGKDTLMFRVANERANYLADATMTVTAVIPGTTAEGRPFTHLRDLQLVRDKSPMFALTWTAMHVLDERSALFGQTEAEFHESRAYLVCTLTGYDAISGQTMHTRHSYMANDVKWRHRHVDILQPPTEHAGPVVDYTRFHDVEPD